MCRFIVVLLVLAAIGCGSDNDPQRSSTPTGDADAAPSGVLTPGPSSTQGPIPTPYNTAQPLAIMGGRVIDGTGAAPIDDGYVLVADGRIENVGCCASTYEVPPGYMEIDASGRTVMPGLIDGHVHVTQTLVNYDPSDLSADVDEESLYPFLSAGITTLRDVGTATVVMRSAKFRIETITARNRAPLVVWSGPLITADGGYPLTVQAYSAGGHAVESIDEAIALVDELADAGARMIKLGLDQGYYGDAGWELLSIEIVRAISDRAHERDMVVTAHVTSVDEVRLALDGGVDDLAHSPLEALPDDLVSEMVQRGMTMVTTATVWGQNQNIAAENVMRYVDAGGVVSIGTDYGCCNQIPGIDPYLRELAFLEGVGLSPMELIVAATRNGATVANVIDETGTLETGKLADIIILDGDPLTDIGTLSNASTVIMQGHVVGG